MGTGATGPDPGPPVVAKPDSDAVASLGGLTPTQINHVTARLGIGCVDLIWPGPCRRRHRPDRACSAALPGGPTRTLVRADLNRQRSGCG